MIIYPLIARGTTVFCEHTGNRGNFQQVTRTILDKIDTTEDAKHCYSYDEYTFHLVVDQGIIYLAMSTKDFEREVAFAFLAHIKQDFEERYADIFTTAVAFEMNKTFHKVLNQQMGRFSSRGAGIEEGEDDKEEAAGAAAASVRASASECAKSKVDKVRAEVDEVKQVMTENIDRILDRGYKIELLVDKSSDLVEQASKFKRSGAQLHRKMWYANLKLQVCVGGSISIGLLILLLTSTKCFGHC